MEEPLQPVKPLEAKDFVKANITLWVWLTFLTLGGSLLALYYARIRYLPDIEWSSSIIYLAVASIIGGSVGLLLSLSLFIPGFLWDEFLICDSKLIGVFCYEEGEKREASVLDVFWLLGFPFGLVLVVSHGALLLGVKPYGVISVMALLASSFFMWRRFKKLMGKAKALRNSGDVGMQEVETKGQPNDGKPGGDWKRICKYTFWFGLSILLSQTSMLLMYLLSGKPTGLSFGYLTAICIVGVLISNHFVSLRYANHPRQAIVGTLVASLLLLASANQFSSLSVNILSRYGFGGGQQYSIFVNEDGAKLATKLGFAGRTCRCGVPAPDRLCDVELLSTLGDEFYLRVGSTSFTLPKAMVISRKTEDQICN